jgi:hypothetical protein
MWAAILSMAAGQEKLLRMKAAAALPLWCI